MVAGTNFSFLTAPPGSIAVYVFYILSGYAIGYGFFSGRYTLTVASLMRYAKNRFLRIAPAYYASLLLCLLVFYPRVAVSTSALLRLVTFTANIDYFTLPYQQLLAIISTEMQFYLIAPILFMLLKGVVRRVSPVSAGIGILIVGCLVRYGMSSIGLVSDLPAYMLHVYVTVWGMIDYFLIGMLVAAVRTGYVRDTTHFPTIPSAALPASAILWTVWVFARNFGSRPWASFALDHLYLIPLTLSPLMAWFLLSTPTPAAKRLPHTAHLLSFWRSPAQFLDTLGTLSYGLYLYHFVFFDLVFRLTDRVADTLPAFLTRLAVVGSVSLVASLASYHFIERPILLRKSS
jgi:peptidoglycan/LPS O-acetylase OafA/YrhL